MSNKNSSSILHSSHLSINQYLHQKTTIYLNKRFIIVDRENHIKDNNEKNLLLIDIIPCKSYLIKNDEGNLLPLNKFEQIKVFALLGIQNFLSTLFAVVVNEAELKLNINGRLVFLIKKASLIQLNKLNKYIYNTELDKIKKDYLSTLHSGFYFSYDYDISNNLQSSDFLSIKSFNKKILYFDCRFTDANKTFLWNKNLISCLFSNDNIKAEVDNDLFKINKLLKVGSKISKTDDYILNHILNSNPKVLSVDEMKNQIFQFFPVLIHGSIEAYEFKDFSKSFIFFIISRKSCDNVSFNNQELGISSHSKLSNFIEIEQVLINIESKAVLLSSLSVISNVPISYSIKYSNYNKKKYVNEMNLKQTEQMLNTIVTEMNSKYKNLFLISCCDINNPGQIILIRQLEDIIRIKNYDFLKYLNINSNWIYKENNKISNIINGINEEFKFYINDERVLQPIESQKGVLWTSFFEWNDYIKSMHSDISLYKLKNLLMNLEIDIDLNENILNQAKSLYESTYKRLFYEINKNNIKKEENSFRFKGIINKYNLILNEKLMKIFSIDEDSQEDININKSYGLITNELNPQLIHPFSMRNSKMSNYFKKKLIEHKLFCFITTFNCNACIPNESNSKELSSLFSLYNKSIGKPKMIIVSIQEAVDLQFVNVIFDPNSDSILEKWKVLIEKTIGKEYSHVFSYKLIGIILIVYAENSVRENIYSKSCEVVKLGFGGKLGNKGGIIFRFNYYLTSIAFVCCHLEAGASKNKIRKSQLDQLMNKQINTRNPFKRKKANLTYEDKNSKGIGLYKELMNRTFDLKVKSHDVVFIIGDLNFRVEMEYNQAISLLKKGEISNILQADQWSKYGNMFNLDEGKINFIPSYKFNKESSVYTTKKMRTPSWCDRILYSQKYFSDVECISYESYMDIVLSDHKPVYGFYDIKVYDSNFPEHDFVSYMENNSLIEWYSKDMFKEIHEKFINDPDISVHYGI